MMLPSQPGMVQPSWSLVEEAISHIRKMWILWLLCFLGRSITPPPGWSVCNGLSSLFTDTYYSDPNWEWFFVHYRICLSFYLSNSDVCHFSLVKIYVKVSCSTFSTLIISEAPGGVTSWSDVSQKPKTDPFLQSSYYIWYLLICSLVIS